MLFVYITGIVVTLIVHAYTDLLAQFVSETYRLVRILIRPAYGVPQPKEGVTHRVGAREGMYLASQRQFVREHYARMRVRRWLSA